MSVGAAPTSATLAAPPPVDPIALAAELRELMALGDQARQRCLQLAGLNAQLLAAANAAAEENSTLKARVTELEAELAALNADATGASD